MSGSWDEYFGTRKWRVATEVDGADAQVRFRKGRFTVDNGQFCSPLSTARGKAGILLQEVSDGQDVTGSRIAVGIVVFRKARNAGAVA